MLPGKLHFRYTPKLQTGKHSTNFYPRRWREAFDAHKNHPLGQQIVPKIFLNATNEKALNKVSLDEPKQFAADHHAMERRFGELTAQPV